MSDTVNLWKSGVPMPSHADLTFPPEAESVVVHRAGSDGYGFLHDAAVVHHDGMLHAGWYNCPSSEIVGESIIRERVSHDGGSTWSDPCVIAQDTENRGIFYVPVQFLSRRNGLYAFISTMTGHDVVTGCEVFRLDGDAWHRVGNIGGPFLPNCMPVLMKDGNYLMAGRMADTPGGKPLTPAVAISRGNDVTGPWDTVPLCHDNLNLSYPETTVIVEDDLLTAFVRNDAGFALVFLSEDCGRSWAEPFEQDMQLGAAKMYAGLLSTGARYIIFNMPTDGYRDLLVLAVGEPGERTFNRMWKLRDGDAPELGIGPEWSYPSATEHDGNLYIVYTSEKHHCVMTVVDVHNV